MSSGFSIVENLVCHAASCTPWVYPKCGITLAMDIRLSLQGNKGKAHYRVNGGGPGGGLGCNLGLIPDSQSSKLLRTTFHCVIFPAFVPFWDLGGRHDAVRPSFPTSQIPSVDGTLRD